MSHLLFNPSYPYSLPVVCAAVVGFCSLSKKIVRAISDFVIFVFQETGRAVRECRKVVDEVRRGHGDDGPQGGPAAAAGVQDHAGRSTDAPDEGKNSVAYDFGDLCSDLRPLLASKTEELLAS